MRVPAKGKAVQVETSRGRQIFYSMGATHPDRTLIVCHSDLCDRDDGWCSNWQEVEITPVVHVPEDMKPVYVWDDVKPAIPHIRISSGNLNKHGWLECYMPTDKGPTSPWRHWEEIL